MIQMLAISGILTIGIGVFKTTKSFFAKAVWGIILFIVFAFLILTE